MNAKLKTILTTAWNEPRAFFFWLFVFCALLFGSAVLFIHSVTPLPAVQMTALFALLGFGGAFGCFVLAWIPPLRRLFAWLLQRRFFVLACLVTAVALVYAVENWRGRHAWADFQREWNAKGEHFDPANLVPPVPDAENFFMAAVWAPFRVAASNATTRLPEENKLPQLLNAYGPQGGQAPRMGDANRGLRTDLRAWQVFYRTNNWFETDDGRRTNYFPVAASPQTPAQDVLLALNKYEATVEQLHEAAQRPSARFWIGRENEFSFSTALLPLLAQMKGCAQYLNLHAIASLANNDGETALKDIQLSIRLAESLNTEPTLIAYLVQIAISNIRGQAIWEGLADHRWSDAQLAALAEAAHQENHLKNYQIGMRGERRYGLQALEQIRRTQSWDWLGDAPPETAKSFWEETLGNSPFRLVPSGWFDQNKVSLSRINVEYFLPLVDVENHLAAPATAPRLRQNLPPRLLRTNPYNLFGAMLFPGLERASEKAGRAQAFNDQIRVACALERHRLAHGNFPETLAALEPQFITKLPHDVINGQPLKYRREPDGSFILYSVGRNETDDGGTVVSRKSGSVDQTKGDWVWRYPAK